MRFVMVIVVLLVMLAFLARAVLQPTSAFGRKRPFANGRLVR
jgi:hypothetical protein